MNPDPEWLRRMADAEDACGSVSVGGLAADLGLYQENQMAVRAKFRCVENQVPEGGNSNKIRLDAVIDGSEENKQFFRYTPSGSINFGCTNDAATAQFEVGKDYYVDFTPAA